MKRSVVLFLAGRCALVVDEEKNPATPTAHEFAFNPPTFSSLLLLLLRRSNYYKQKIGIPFFDFFVITDFFIFLIMHACLHDTANDNNNER